MLRWQVDSNGFIYQRTGRPLPVPGLGKSGRLMSQQGKAQAPAAVTTCPVIRLALIIGLDRRLVVVLLFASAPGIRDGLIGLKKRCPETTDRSQAQHGATSLSVGDRTVGPVTSLLVRGTKSLVHGSGPAHGCETTGLFLHPIERRRNMPREAGLFLLTTCSGVGAARAMRRFCYGQTGVSFPGAAADRRKKRNPWRVKLPNGSARRHCRANTRSLGGPRAVLSFPQVPARDHAASGL